MKNEGVSTSATEKNYKTKRCENIRENYLKRTGAAKLCKVTQCAMYGETEASVIKR